MPFLSYEFNRCPKHHKDFVGALCPECAEELDAKIEPSKQEGFGPDPFNVWGQTQTAMCEGAATGHKEPALGDCLDEAKKTICGERQDIYGSPEDSFGLIADYWNIYLSGMSGSALIAKDVAHMMVLFKMARVQGQAPKRDNYVDLCGYAAIAADRLSSETAATIKGFEEIMFPKDVAWKDGAPGCPHTRTKFVKTAAGVYRQCLGCGARLEVA